MKNKKIILISIIFIAILLTFFSFSKRTQEKIPPTPPYTEKSRTSPVAVLEINDIKYEEKITDQTSVYDFMDKLQKNSKINFTEKNYTGMGKLIEEINGLKNSGDKNWIYYVNGKKAEIGVSNYKIKPGDVVSWKYEENY